MAPANTNTLDYTLAGGYLVLGWIDGQPFPRNCDSKTDKCDTVYVGDYFRFRAGELTDNLSQRTLAKIGKTQITAIDPATQFSGAVEWFPVWDIPGKIVEKLGWPIGLGEWASGKPVFLEKLGIGTVQLLPSLIFEYDEALNSRHIVLFSNLRRAERLGPQAIVKFMPFAPDPNQSAPLPQDNLAQYLRSELSQLTLSTTYHYWHEFQSKENAYALQASASIPLLTGINFKIQYQRGMDEGTGKNANLFTIGLSGQFCSTNCPSSGSSGSSQSSAN